jgi:hypothetical protein
MQPPHPGSLPQVNVLSCPGCGAPLDAPAITGQVRCQYCGRTVNVSRPAPGPVPSPRLPAPPAPVTRTGGGGRATLLAAVLVLALAVGGWAVVSLGVFAARIASPTLRSTPPAATTARSEAAIPVARLDQLGMDRSLDLVATWAGDARFAVEPSRLQVRLSDSRFASLSPPGRRAGAASNRALVATSPLAVVTLATSHGPRPPAEGRDGPRAVDPRVTRAPARRVSASRCGS